MENQQKYKVISVSANDPEMLAKRIECRLNSEKYADYDLFSVSFAINDGRLHDHRAIVTLVYRYWVSIYRSLPILEKEEI